MHPPPPLRPKAYTAKHNYGTLYPERLPFQAKRFFQFQSTNEVHQVDEYLANSSFSISYQKVSVYLKIPESLKDPRPATCLL